MQSPEANGTGSSRREFLRGVVATGVAGVAAPHVLPAAALGLGGRTPPSERIRLGLIGAGSMGRANLNNCTRYEDVVVTAVCDVWQRRRDAVVGQHADTARGYGDYRELLASDDVDAVIIATPPHWHALMAVAACEAKKDLYLQKPMTLYPDEALAIRNAVRKHDRVSQIGTQIHASENYRRVVEAVRAGRIGKVSAARTFFVMNQGPEGIGRTPDGAPPDDLDWDGWVGPAPHRPFNELIVRDAASHCSFMTFSGGWTPGMAPHIVDLPYWALGLGYPLTTSCSGGRFVVNDAGDIPDVQEVSWRFPDCVLTWSLSVVNSFGFDFGRGTRTRRLGVYFHGSDGTLFSDYNRHELVPEGDRFDDSPAETPTLPPSPGHEREWLDCVRSRAQPSCSTEYHTPIDVAIGLANLSHALGRSVRFDPNTETILDDAEAAAAARPGYRDGYEFPAAYLDRV